MRQTLSTAIVAVIVSLLTLTFAGAVAQSEPAKEDVDPAALARNADKVDGKHAVRATRMLRLRAKKLVATDKKGFLPDNIVRPLWRLIQGKPAVLADGQVAWGEVVGKPPGFVDNVDNAGVTKVKVKRVNSNAKVLVNGAWTEHSVSCPAGMVLVGGGGVSSDFTTGKVHLTDSYSYGSNWWVGFENLSGASVDIYAIAHCLSVEPADRLEPSGMRKAGVPAGKRS